MKTFTIGGVSTGPDGVKQWRFANGSAAARAKVLEDHDHTDIRFLDLPRAMTKEEGIAWLRSQDIDSAPITVGRAERRPLDAPRAVRVTRGRQKSDVSEHVPVQHENIGRALFIAGWRSKDRAMIAWQGLRRAARQAWAMRAAILRKQDIDPDEFVELEQEINTGNDDLAAIAGA